MNRRLNGDGILRPHEHACPPRPLSDREEDLRVDSLPICFGHIAGDPDNPDAARAAAGAGGHVLRARAGSPQKRRAIS